MVTVQELENAKIDARTIGESVNENKIVTPRYGAPFKSMPMIAEEMQSIIGTIIGGGVPAGIVLDGNQAQDEINLYGGKKYDMPAGGYLVGGLVRLDNGDIVKSTVANNTANPNVDMTGWARDVPINNAQFHGCKPDGTDISTAFINYANSLPDGATLFLPKGEGEYFWDASGVNGSITKNISIKSDGAVIRVKGLNGYTPFLSLDNPNVTVHAATDVFNSLNKGDTVLNVKGAPLTNPANYFAVLTSTELAIHRPLFAEDYTKNITVDIVDGIYTMRDPLPFGFDDLSKVTVRFVKKQLPFEIDGFKVIPTDDHPDLTYYIQMSYKYRGTDNIVVDASGRQSDGILVHHNRCVGCISNSTLIGANKPNTDSYAFSQSVSSYLKYKNATYQDSDYPTKSSKGASGRHGFMNSWDNCHISGVDDHWGYGGHVANMHMNKGVSWAGGSLKVENCTSIEGLVTLRMDTPYADGTLEIIGSDSSSSIFTAMGNSIEAQTANDFAPHKVWDTVKIDGIFYSDRRNLPVILMREPHTNQTNVFRNTTFHLKAIYIENPVTSQPLFEIYRQKNASMADVEPYTGDLNSKKLFGTMIFNVTHIINDDVSVVSRKNLLVGAVADDYIINSDTSFSFKSIRANNVTINSAKLKDSKTELNTIGCNKLYLNNYKFEGGRNIYAPPAALSQYPTMQIELLNPHAQQQNIIYAMLTTLIKSSRAGVFATGQKTAAGWDLTNYDRDFCTTYTFASDITIPANSSSSEQAVGFGNANYDSFVQPLLVFGDGSVVVDMIRKRSSGVEWNQYFKLRNTSASPVTITSGTVVRFKVI